MTKKFVFRGVKGRTGSHRRYIVVRIYDGRVVILKRSDNYATAYKERRGWSDAGIIDTVTGFEVDGWAGTRVS